jgi:hypothetical protein
MLYQFGESDVHLSSPVIIALVHNASYLEVPKEESVRLRKASCNVFIREESTKRQALYGIHGKSDFSILIIIAIHRSRIIVKQIGCNLAA